MGKELPGSFYNAALAAVAVGYVLLLVVLMHGGSRQKAAPPPGSLIQQSGQGSRNPSGTALAVARNGAAALALQPTPGTIHSSCNASGSGWLCAVQGFTRLNGVGVCTIDVFVSGVSSAAYTRSYACQ
jgi:hypothetical protein